MKTPKTKLSVEEKMALARQKAAEQKEKERLQEEAYYQKISSGPAWKVFKVLSIYCVLLAAVMLVETLMDGETRKIPRAEVAYEEAVIAIDDRYYTPLYTEIAGFIDTTFRVVYSPLFDQPKYLVWTSEYEDTKTPLTLTDYDAWQRNSIYEYFIFIQLVLLVPILVVWYKRPSPLFKFGRMLCLTLIFPAGIYLFFVTIGVFDLLPF